MKREIANILPFRLSALAVLTCATLALMLLAPGAAQAQMGPDYWKVANVPANDHLNIRSGPSTANRVVAHAPNGAVFRNLGCEGTGNARWCHLETPDGGVNGWASGRFLVESGAPNTGNVSGNNDIPELHVRRTGEIEVRYASGCTALYNPAGRRINAGSSCSRQQLSRAHNAVEGYMRENASSDFHEGGAAAPANVNVSGSGTITNTGNIVTASIRGHNEGHYVLVIVGDGATCTGAMRHAPGAFGSETTSIHCTNGAHGAAILGQNGRLLTFNLTNGTAGFVKF